MRILAISGSLRTGSSNGTLLRAAAMIAPSGVEVVAYDGLGALPHFNPDLDDGDALPDVVSRFRKEIADADGLMISCPEYAHGVPGTMKNALDWLVGGVEITGKPVALVNASARATSQSLVNAVMLPPTIVWSVPPIVPKIERERTVMPRTTPKVRTIRKPSSVNAVVTM